MYELQKLNAKHQKMIELCLEGYKCGDLAKITGLTPQGVTIITNSPKFQDQLSRRRGELNKKHDEGVSISSSQAKDVLEQGALEAAKTHVELLSSNDERVQQKSASEILDRVGVGKTVNQQESANIA